MRLDGRHLLLALLLLLFGGVLLASSPRTALGLVTVLVNRSHADVPVEDAWALDDWLADPRRRKPLLVDVRTAAEWEVSHLPGARSVPQPDAAAAPFADLPRSTPIVVYCSVGWRSAKAVRTLRAAGFTEVRNLSGGIFVWANRGHRMVRPDGRRATLVHPYTSNWGRLLDPRVRAEPDSP